MNKKTKIILLLIILSLTILGIAVWYNRIPQETGNNGDIKAERLKDPNLLYASMYWTGLCGNEKGEQGGCYAKTYFYFDGKLMEYSGFVVYGGKEDDKPSAEIQLSSDMVSQVIKQIRDSGIMAKDCPPDNIMDAGWDYQLNIDGVKKSFSNPPKDCKEIFDEIDKVLTNLFN